MGSSVEDEFVARFAEAWAKPSPTGFSHLFAPEIRLIAPMLPATEGIPAAEAGFARLLAVFRGLHGVVHDWAPHPQGVFIDFTLAGTLGGHPVSWRGVDRFLLRSGLATERVHYFDTLPVMLLTRRAWRAWPGLMRARARPRPPHLAPPPGAANGLEAPPVAPALTLALLGDGAELHVPGLPPLSGRHRLAKLQAMLPELRRRIVRRGTREETLYVESIYEAQVGGRHLRWPQIDRIELDGSAPRRWDAFLDTLPFALRWRRRRHRQAIRELRSPGNDGARRPGAR